MAKLDFEKTEKGDLFFMTIHISFKASLEKVFYNEKTEMLTNITDDR